MELEMTRQLIAEGSQLRYSLKFFSGGAKKEPARNPLLKVLSSRRTLSCAWFSPDAFSTNNKRKLPWELVMLGREEKNLKVQNYIA